MKRITYGLLMDGKELQEHSSNLHHDPEKLGPILFWKKEHAVEERALRVQPEKFRVVKVILRIDVA